MTVAPQVLIDRFMPEGRLRRLPGKAAKRAVVLEHIVQRFEPGRHYAEKQVDAILLGVCGDGETDHVSIRRYLVDLGLLERENGVYWRSGGPLTDA